MSQKKLVSLALAVVMLAALAVPAFAASAGNTTVVTGAYQEVPVSVSVPGNTTATINPYALPVKIGTSASGGDIKVSGQQIVSLPMMLANEGDVDLNVSVTVSATQLGGLKLATAELAKDDQGKVTVTDKSAFVYLQIVADDATDGDLKDLKGVKDTDAANILAALLAAYTNDDVWADAGTDIVFTTKEVKHENVIVIKAAKTPIVEASGGNITTQPEYDVGSIAVLRIAGEVVTEPKTKWSEGARTGGGADGSLPIPADGFEAKIVFSFSPNV